MYIRASDIDILPRVNICGHKCIERSPKLFSSTLKK